MIEHVLKASMEQQLIVTIIYQKDNCITKRNIKVIELDGENVKAFCYLRRQRRIFKKQNILAAEFLRRYIYNCNNNLAVQGEATQVNV